MNDLIKIKRGGPLDGKHYAFDGDVIRITLANFYEEGGFKESNFDRNIFYNGEIKQGDLLKKGALITPLTEQVHGLLGSIARIPESNKYIPCGDIGIIEIIDTNKIDENYLYYFFQTEYARKQLTRGAQKSKIRHINANDFYNVYIGLPEIEDQQLIGSLLYKIDEIINNNNKMITELNIISKAIYSYWFLQFDFPNKDGKPYKSSGGEMKFSHRLNKYIPKSFKDISFGEVTENISTGLNPRQHFKLNNGGNIKYITVKNLNEDGMIDFKTCDLIDEEANNKIKQRTDLKKGDILYASIAPLGRAYLLPEDPIGWNINESVFSVRVNSNFMTSEYAFLTMQSEEFVKRASLKSTGSIFKGIRISDLNSTNILLPPKDVIDDFTKIVKSFFIMKEKLTKENDMLNTLKNWMLPMLMNGQVKINCK